MTKAIGFVDSKIVERFDCYEGTSAKTKLSKDLYVQGVNFFARKPESPREPQSLQASNRRDIHNQPESKSECSP